MEPLLIAMELKNQQFIVKGDPLLTFQCDIKWTTEALINIIKNCIEHTGEGGEISIRYNDNPISTDIIISDNGVGIAKEDLMFIFKRFYRGKNASEDSVGIGLAMAKSIIMNQNGDIFVSNKKQGVEFNIKFYKHIV